jgi:AraC-like DNA-binding protein
MTPKKVPHGVESFGLKLRLFVYSFCVPRRKPKQYPIIPASAWPTLPAWHGLLSPVVANTFAELRVSIAFWIGGDFWHVIHLEPNVGLIESNLGLSDRRWSYDGKQFALVKQHRKLVCGEHSGFFDLFVPVVGRGKLHGVLVAGPFAKGYPSSKDVQERWRALTGGAGRLSEPLFAEYVGMTLGTLTLEGERSAMFEKLLTCFSTLLSDQGDANALAAEASALGRELQEARIHERMWDAARRLVEEKSAAAWPLYGRTILLQFGLRERVEHVVVGLLGTRREEPDPLDQLLRGAAFQRECVALARKTGGVVSGRVGDTGVSFLLDGSVRRGRARSKLNDLVGAAHAVARKFGFSLHAGVGQVPGGTAVPAAYRAARWAAEKALAEGARLVHGELDPEPSQERLRQIRDQLGRSVEERPDLVMARFDRYVETLLSHAVYRVEAARTELEIAVERLLSPILAASLIEPKTLRELRTVQDRAAAEAQTVTELVAAYRGVVAGVERALRSPITARRERSTERAMRYVREHLAERLTLKQGARVAGLAPSYFARIFNESEGMSFAEYVRSQRVQRARDMLQTTSLSIEQVQKLCGFQSRASFYRLFKTAVGTTPGDFREKN